MYISREEYRNTEVVQDGAVNLSSPFEPGSRIRRIVGAGMNSSLNVTGEFPAIRLPGRSRMSIKNLALSGVNQPIANSEGGSDCTGIYAEACDDIRLKNVASYYFKFSPFVFRDCVGVDISKCSTFACPHGPIFYDVNNIVMRNTRITGSTNTTALSVGVSVNTYLANPRRANHNVLIEGNYIEGFQGGQAVLIHHGSMVRVRRNYIRNVLTGVYAGAALNSSHKVSQVDISENYIEVVSDPNFVPDETASYCVALSGRIAGDNLEQATITRNHLCGTGHIGLTERNTALLAILGYVRDVEIGDNYFGRHNGYTEVYGVDFSGVRLSRNHYLGIPYRSYSPDFTPGELDLIRCGDVCMRE